MEMWLTPVILVHRCDVLWPTMTDGNLGYVQEVIVTHFKFAVVLMGTPRGCSKTESNSFNLVQWDQVVLSPAFYPGYKFGTIFLWIYCLITNSTLSKRRYFFTKWNKMHGMTALHFSIMRPLLLVSSMICAKATGFTYIFFNELTLKIFWQIIKPRLFTWLKMNGANWYHQCLCGSVVFGNPLWQFYVTPLVCKMEHIQQYSNETSTTAKTLQYKGIGINKCPNSNRILYS